MSLVIDPLVNKNNPAKKASRLTRLRNFYDARAGLTGGLTLVGLALSIITWIVAYSLSPASSLPLSLIGFASVPFSAATITSFAIGISSVFVECYRLSDYLSSVTNIRPAIEQIEADLPKSGLSKSAQIAILTQVQGVLQQAAQQLHIASTLPSDKAAPLRIEVQESLAKVQTLRNYVDGLCAQQRALEDTTAAQTSTTHATQTSAKLKAISSQLDNTLELLSATQTARSELLPKATE